jgi:hypothetical protein
MATQKQIAANRKNALKSTGPRSVPGKMISSRNSTSHGFYASNVLLPKENRQEYLSFARRLAFAYAPGDALEEQEVKTIIETRWQLSRTDLVENELYQMFGFYEDQERGVGTAFANDASQANAFSKLARYQGFLIRKLQIAEKKLAELKARVLALQPAVLPDHAPVLDSGQISVATTAVAQRNEISALDLFKWLSGRDSREMGSVEG